MINVYQRELVNNALRKTAVLDNAFGVKETQTLNGIYEMEFSLPSGDVKSGFCLPFCFARWEDGGELYRITSNKSVDAETGTITYHCEHAICTLIDNILFGSFTYGGDGVTTREVIEWLLSKQSVARWQLGTCDFSYEYEYGWEQENLLNALYSVAEVFSTPYRWSFDTSSYPWTVNLTAIDTTIHPEFYIRAEKNLLEANSEADNSEIVTRLYPLGYGEGVNQLTIRSVNGNVPYLQNAAAVAQYGVIEKALVDRSFEDAALLKAYAQTVLNQLSVPGYSRSFSIADLHDLTEAELDKAEVGKVARLTLDDTVTYITKTVKNYDVAGDISIELSTRADSVIDQIADLADRVRIESTYAQGATQLYQHSKDENASSEKGMKVELYFPSEMKQINKVLAKIKIGKFRAYSQATAGGGGSSQTSSSGGGSTQTSGTGGGGSSTTTSGSSSKTTSDSANPYGVTTYVSGSISVGSSSTSGTVIWTGSSETSSSSGSGSHTHWVSGHAHGFSGGSHSHYGYFSSHAHGIESGTLVHSHGMDHTHSVSFSYPAHSHSVTIPSHTHSITIPSHTHEITPGIYEFGGASSAGIYIGGNLVATIDTSWNDDITSWLVSDGSIPRNQWITMEIRPNDLAYINCTIFIQGFVQSRGGGNY